MAFTYGFYNSLNGDRRYRAEQFNDLIGSLLTDGVFENIGSKLFVTVGTGMDINVGTGKAWFDNTWNVNDSVMVLTVPQSDITRPRYDAVVLDVDSDLSARENKIMIVSGDPGTTPVKPTLINTEKHHQHPLAYILVPAAATEITASNIEIVVGQTACPFVTGILQTTDITDLYNQWESDFSTWFTNLQTQLTDNVVTNLQTQIDALRGDVDEVESSVTSLTTRTTELEGKSVNIIETGSIFALPNGYSKEIVDAFPCLGGGMQTGLQPKLFNCIGYSYGGVMSGTENVYNYTTQFSVKRPVVDAVKARIYAFCGASESSISHIVTFDSSFNQTKSVQILRDNTAFSGDISPCVASNGMIFCQYGTQFYAVNPNEGSLIQSENFSYCMQSNRLLASSKNAIYILGSRSGTMYYAYCTPALSAPRYVGIYNNTGTAWFISSNGDHVFVVPQVTDESNIVIICYNKGVATMVTKERIINWSDQSIANVVNQNILAKCAFTNNDREYFIPWHYAGSIGYIRVDALTSNAEIYNIKKPTNLDTSYDNTTPIIGGMYLTNGLMIYSTGTKLRVFDINRKTIADMGASDVLEGLATLDAIVTYSHIKTATRTYTCSNMSFFVPILKSSDCEYYIKM